MDCPRSPLVLVAALFTAAPAGCGDPDDGASDGATSTSDASASSTAATSTATSTAGETTGDATTGSGEGLTYYRDIKAIVDARCVTCHRAGDIAPFALETVDQVQAMAPFLAASIADGSMPPWPPDAACNTYTHARALADAESAALLEWIDAGAPAGDPADAPAPVDPEPPIDYDLELSADEAYQPTVLPDDYRCFIFDWPKDQVTYVTALDVIPGDRSTVHHGIAFVIPSDQIGTFEALDDADPGPGYPCYGGPGGETASPAQWLGAWVPGAQNGGFPEGTGIRVEPGSKVILQMHYHPYLGAGADLSTIQLRTADTVDRPALLAPMVNVGWLFDQPPMTIPAGAADTVHSADIGVSGMLNLLFPGNALSAGPLLIHLAGVHMHTVGTRASLTVNDADNECLVDVQHWDFNWQGIYELEAPVRVEPGTSVHLECHYDNSAGAKSLKWGEGTEDEMCLGILYVTAAE